MQNSKLKIQNSKLRRLIFILCSLHFALCILFLPATPAFAQGEGITEQYRKALEMNPDDMDARYLLGVSLLREKSYKEALVHLIKAYPSRAGEAEMNYNMGLAYAGNGEPDKAFQHYRKVDEINSVEARDRFHLDAAFYNLGIAFQKEGKLDDALEAYQEAIQINNDQINAYCTRGEILYQKKDYNAALENLMICKTKNPERKGVNRFISAINQARGIDYLNEKNFTEARIELDKAISLDPANEAANYYMGYLEYLDGNFKKSLSFLEKIKGTEREDMKKALLSMLHNVGGAMQKDEDWHGAVDTFKIAASIARENPEWHFYLGYSYLKTQKFDDSIAELKEALRLDPKHQKAAVNLAIVTEVAIKTRLKTGTDYLNTSSYNEALQEFNAVLSLDLSNQKGIEGKAAAEKGLEKQAREATERRKKEIGERLLEGNKFIVNKRYLEAVKSFEAVLLLDPSNQKAGEEIVKAKALLKEAKGRHLADGEKYFADGKYYAAVLEFRIVLENDPSEGTASSRLEECLKRLSERIFPLMNEAAHHENAGRLAEAMAAYNKIFEIYPDHKDALAGKNRVSEKIGKAFDEALAKGREYAASGELMKAAESLGRALELKPDNEIAIEEFKAISGKLKKVIDTRLADAAASLRAGRLAEAVTGYKAVLLIDRGNKEAAAGLQNAQKQKDEAVEKRMSAGIKAFKDGNFYQAVTAFGEVLQIDGGNAEALRLQKESRARIDELVVPWMKTGIDAYKKGDIDAATISFKKVLNVDPANKEAREYLGKMDTQKAKASVDKEIEKNYLKGIELYTDGKYREAMESWKKVLELDPKHEKASLNIEKAKRKMEGVMETK